MASLAELGEIAKAAVPKKTNLSIAEDWFGRKTMQNRRARLKHYESELKAAPQHSKHAAQEQFNEAQKDYGRAATRRVGSLAVAFGTPAVVGYRYGSRRQPVYQPAPVPYG